MTYVTSFYAASTGMKPYIYMEFAESTNLSTQPYKFDGQKLVTANGLNEYDFGARQNNSAVPGFTD